MLPIYGSDTGVDNTETSLPDEIEVGVVGYVCAPVLVPFVAVQPVKVPASKSSLVQGAFAVIPELYLPLEFRLVL